MRYIRNINELLDINDEITREARRIALELLDEGLSAADPREAVHRKLKIENGELRVGGYRLKLSSFNSVYVVGAGKASGGMAQALEEILGDFIEDGYVIVPKPLVNRYKLKKIKLLGATHPIPSEENRRHSEKIISLISSADEGDLIICLISGGGSALMCCPYDEVSMDDMMTLTKLLLGSGANINEVNVVRKHVEKLKGGKLARLAYPATVLSLIISDVVGDPLDTIASGPTAPDESTFGDALNVLRKYGVADKAPKSILNVLEKGLNGLIEETVKPGDKVFGRVYNVIIASNEISLNTMYSRALDLGLNAMILTSYLEGEAREVGIVLASIARQIYYRDQPLAKPCAVLVGGETTVTLDVYGGGRGGRNQELACSAALYLNGMRGAVLASIGSDGIDGNSDVAGAIVDAYTIREAEGKVLDIFDYLRRHDTYSFFKALGKHLIYTGPTGTNVNDLTVIVCLK